MRVSWHQLNLNWCQVITDTNQYILVLGLIYWCPDQIFWHQSAVHDTNLNILVSSNHWHQSNILVLVCFNWCQNNLPVNMSVSIYNAVAPMHLHWCQQNKLVLERRDRNQNWHVADTIRKARSTTPALQSLRAVKSTPRATKGPDLREIGLLAPINYDWCDSF